jgi:murein DD-endopeptidase MepM/ murein hydrolase activator NlpD
MRMQEKRIPAVGGLSRWILPVLITGLLSAAGCTGGKGTAELTAAAEDEPENGRENGRENRRAEDFSLSALFADAAEFKYIHPAYSADDRSDAPWGFKHQGLDLITATSGTILAPADGRIEQVQEYFNPVNNLWQVNLHIRYDDRFSYNLFFEPRAATAERNAAQRAAIPVAEGSRVAAGDTIGTVLNLSSEESGFGDVTVHFDLWVEGRNVCPEPYFKPEVRAAMLALLHAKFPEARLCYPSQSTTGVDR